MCTPIAALIRKNLMVWVLPLKEDFDILVESKGGKVFFR